MLYQKLLTSVGSCFIDFSGATEFEMHLHPEIEFSYCVKGKYNIIIGSTEYILNEGDLVLVNPMELHELGNRIDKDSLRLTIEVGPAFLREEFNAFVLMNPKSSILRLKSEPKSPCFTELAKLLDEITELLSDKPPFYNLAVKGNIYKISAILSRMLTENLKEPETVTKSLKDIEKISRAINIIYRNYSEQLTLDDVSAVCGYSKSNFCKIFKTITGESFHAMLNRHRIEIACIKLKEPNNAIEDIALSVGFADTKNFCRVFKKIKGINAGEYRKTIKAR